MYSTVVVACHCLAAGTQSAAHYDIFAGAAMDVTRWSFTSYYWMHKNVTEQADGTLPRGVSYVVKHAGPAEYEVVSGCLEGTASLLPGAALDYTHTARLQYEQRVSTTPEIWQLVTNDYLTRFRVDDYANEPADTLHLGALVVQTTWSANNGWVAGYLHAGETWYNDYLPADVDVVRVDTGAGVYCVETKLAANGKSPLGIAVFKKQANNNEYDGDQIGWTNGFNVYNDQGQIDGLRQRVYFTLDNDNGAYVQLSLTNAEVALDYKVRVFRARPVILVHGIDSNPKTATDPLSTMGHYKLAAPYDAALMPAVVYDFPWDSKTQDIMLDSTVGLVATFIAYVENKYTAHNMPVVLIGHSMGGYLCRHYIRQSSLSTHWNWCFLLGSPQYGSDIANSSVSDILNYYFGNTSAYNLDALKRGSTHSWTMHEWIGNIDSRVVCVAGHRNAGYAKAHLITSYKGGLTYSDGVVPVSSANLRSISGQVKFHLAYMNHHRIGVFTNNEENQNPQNTFQDDVYNIIKDYLD